MCIDYDNTIQKRRGFGEYSASAFSSAPKQAFTYKSRLLTHYAQKLSFDSNGIGTFTDFNGSFEELVQGLRIKAIEANGNLYFTTNKGIKKISVKDVDDLNSAEVTNAGGIKAIDLNGKAIPDASGFLPAQSKVAYRLVYGTKDANSNLILGYPSSRVIVTNTSQDVNQSETFTVNFISYSAIADSDYILFDSEESSYFVWFNKTGAATAPINADTLDREGVEVDIQSATDNDSAAAILANVLSSTLTDVTVDLNSSEVQITVSGAGDVPDPGQGSLLSSEVLVTKIIDGSITTGTPSYTQLTFVLPEEITTNYFYQVYRTGVVTVETGLTINDIDPGDEQQFIFEYPITAADITAGEIVVTDNTPEAFRASGAYLPTNQFSGQGIAQANERPPIATDIALFRNSTFYANTKDVHRLNLSILSVDNFVSGDTKLFIGRGDSASQYTFVGVVGVNDVDVVERDLTVGSSYFTINSANDERSYYVWADKGTITHSFDSTADVASNQITITSHGFATNDKITFTGTLPTGLSASTDYYAIRVDANTISVAATVGGSAIALSDVVGTGTVIHVSVDPAVSAKLGIRVPLELYDNTVDGSKEALLDSLLSTVDFTAEDYDTNTVRITCADSGATTAPTTTGWTITVITAGDGEDAVSNEVLLSVSDSVATSIDLTARSLVRVINKDADCPVIAQYMSGPDDLPGKILLEAKTLEDLKFYVAISDSALSGEFSPELPENVVLESISNTTQVFTTSSAHGFSVGDEIYIHDNPGATETEFAGAYTIATVPTSTTFTLEDVEATINQPGPLSGFAYRTTAASDNNQAPNRIYYSKTSQPEAVPIVNYIDVGSKDKQILRILALRDNLFVLKQDGVYIVTGPSAPNFSVRLLDNSAILIAPDSAVVLNNLIYALTSQGVVSISETGVSIISRQIEDQIKKVTTFAYSYATTSFGVAYESDRSYLLWLPTNKTDTVANQCFRYNSITNNWTRWTKTNTCGIVNPGDDRMYLGKGDGRNFIEQERKNGTRQDYSDRSFVRSINASAFSDNSVVISSVTDVEEGDVIVQTQYVTIPKFNRLLSKLDRDAGVTDSDYRSTLEAVVGDNLSTKLQELVTKLNSDSALSGFTAPSGINTLSALKTDYNTLIGELNDPTSGTASKDYREVSDLISYEVLIENVTSSTNTVDINIVQLFIQGEIEIFKGYECEVQWAPQHFGAPEKLKQVHEGTLIFDQGTIYGGTVAYSSDRSADFVEIDFEMSGPGTWASFPWLQTIWGGNSNEVPLRTLIPSNKSRCRYLHVKFKHRNAREEFKLLGISLEPREVSTRGYR